MKSEMCNMGVRNKRITKQRGKEGVRGKWADSDELERAREEREGPIDRRGQ